MYEVWAMPNEVTQVIKRISENYNQNCEPTNV